jgi:hypothetical protein
MVFPKVLGPCILVWKNPSRTHSVNEVYWKLGKGNTKGSMVGAGRICWQREHALIFQGFLKPSLTHGKGRPRRFPSNHLWGGKGTVQCLGQVRVVPGPGMGNLKTHTILRHIFFMSPELSLILACLTCSGWAYKTIYAARLN